MRLETVRLAFLQHASSATCCCRLLTNKSLAQLLLSDVLCATLCALLSLWAFLPINAVPCTKTIGASVARSLARWLGLLTVVGARTATPSRLTSACWRTDPCSSSRTTAGGTSTMGSTTKSGPAAGSQTAAPAASPRFVRPSARPPAPRPSPKNSSAPRPVDDDDYAPRNGLICQQQPLQEGGDVDSAECANFRCPQQQNPPPRIQRPGINLTQKAADDAEVAAGSVHTVAVDYDASSRPLAVSSVVDAVGATLPFERLQRLREALRQVAAEAPQVCARVRQGLGESRRTSGVLYMLLGDPATEAVIAEVHTARQNKIIARLLSFVLSQALAHCAGSRSPRWRRSSATSLLCQQTGAWPSLAARSPSTCRRCSHLSVGREYVLLVHRVVCARLGSFPKLPSRRSPERVPECWPRRMPRSSTCR